MERNQLPSRLLSDSVRFCILIGLIITFILTMIYAASCGWLNKDGIQKFVLRGGRLAPIVYVLCASFLSMFWVPRWFFTTVAGALFGTQYGMCLGLLAGVLGGLGGYTMGWHLGQDYLKRRVRGKGRLVMDFVARHGFRAIILGRVCPLISCQFVSVSSGALGISLICFIPATVLGMAPGAFLYAAFGASLFNPDSLRTTVATLIAFIGLSVFAGYLLLMSWKQDRARLSASSGIAQPQAVRKAVNNSESPALKRSVEHYLCPECGESIPVAAKTCRFCRTVFAERERKQ